MSKNPAKDERDSDEEAKARFEAALRGALKTPHEPLRAKAVKKED
jgi:hypothetical protein